MTQKEIKSLIGAATYARIKTFAKRQKKLGRAPADVKKALKARFGRRLKTVNSSLILEDITGAP